MRQNKKKYLQHISLLPVLCIGICCVVKNSEFLNYNNYGIPLLIVSFLLLVIAGICNYLPQFQKKSKWLTLLKAILFFLAPLLMEVAVELLNGNMLWDIDMFGNVLMNYFINLILYGIVWVILGNAKWSLRLVTVFLEIFGIANFYVKQFKGSPLLPWDIGSIGTAAAVAGSYTYAIGCEILFSLCVCSVIWKYSRFVTENRKTLFHRFSRAVTALSLAILLFVYYGTDIISKAFGATPDFFNQTRGYESKGAIAEFFVNTRYMHLGKPDGYDVSTLKNDVVSHTDNSSNGILESNTGEKVQDVNVKQPNVIVIMNESYSDLSVIGDFDTNEDYMPYVNSLRNEKNVIEGNCYVSTIGTGTSNTEYEFLTGNTMGFLPYGSNAYQLYVDHETESLVSTLKSQNYSAQALHPYYKDDWNRPAVYEDFGFDSFTAYEDKGWWDKLRRYVSDECDFRTIEDMYETRDTSKPFFMFNITMQNHSSYDQTDPDFDQEITLENMKGDYPLTEQYLSLIKKTDEAFEDLIQYFSNVDEPTIVLMFGDHQPFIENSFYEEVMGKPLNQLSDEENQKRYITRFIMWANYDIPSGWIDSISANYLSVLLAQCSGMQTTPYMNFLNTLYKDVPVITALGCKDADGHYFRLEDENPYKEILSIYRNTAYNLLREDDNRIDELFTLSK